ESRIAGRNQRALTKFGPVVPRVRVNDNLAGVVARTEKLTDQFIETELLRTGQFGRAIERRGDGDSGDGLRDVISRHGLNECVRQTHLRSLGGLIGDALDELEELRRVNNRVRDPATLDQRFLSILRLEVRTVGNAPGAYDGQRNVMLHA